MHGRQHADFIGQGVVQPDQCHLEQVGGSALDDGIDGVTAGLGNIARKGRVDVRQMTATLPADPT